MHKDSWKNSKFLNESVIELPQVQFDPEDFLGFIDQYEFQNYTNVYGKSTPQHTCDDERFQEDPLIQYYLDVFKDFDIRQSVPESTLTNYPEKTRLTGWLVKCDTRGSDLHMHRDANRPTGIIFPLTFPQSVNLHESKKSGISYVHEYKPVITILNTGGQWHSVSKSPNIRYQVQFDCYNSWEEIRQLVNTLNKV